MRAQQIESIVCDIDFSPLAKLYYSIISSPELLLVASKTAIMAALKIPGVALARTGDKFPLMGMSRAVADLCSYTLVHNAYADLASAFRFGGLEGGKGPDSTNRRSRHPQGHQVLGRKKAQGTSGPSRCSI
jgi:hypothetical protein